MVTNVRNFIDELHMVEGKDTVIAGVSGGADSVCLLLVLEELRQVYGYGLAVVHVNHGIRGEEALRDQKYVEELCDKYKIPCHVYEEDVKGLAQRLKLTEEEAGRNVRYACFEKTAKKYEKPVVAVAHHREDQAETMLFRMARGTGVTGLKGMLPVMEREEMIVIRPLLKQSRQEIEGYLAHRQIAYCQDTTNESLDYQRNYIRHQIMPAFEKINHKAIEHFMQLSEQAAQLDSYLHEQAVEFIKNNVKEVPDAKEYKTLWRFSAEALMALPKILQQEVLREVMKYMASSLKDISRRHIELLLSCLYEPQARIDLPYGLAAFRSYEFFLLGQRQEKEKIQNNLENLEKSFCFREYSYDIHRKIDKKNYTKTIDCDKIEGMLSVRFRQPGDYIVVDSLGHQKSLKKFFIDEKIPQYKRDSIPLVCDGQQVIWIVGYRLSAAFYVTEQTVKALDMIYLSADSEN